MNDLTDLGPRARLHHDNIKQQRINALNNSLIKLSEMASRILFFIKSNDLDGPDIKSLIYQVEDVVGIVSTKSICIKHDIKIISSCNYNWIMVQPMVTSTDIQNYCTFMTATYLQISKDISLLCNDIENYIDLFQKKMIALQSTKNTKIATSWYSFIIQYTFGWINYWRK
jgi:hypothetical protein